MQKYWTAAEKNILQVSFVVAITKFTLFGTVLGYVTFLRNVVNIFVFVG